MAIQPWRETPHPAVPAGPPALRVKADFFRRYLEIAPAALALERSIECDMLARRSWHRPVLDVGCGDGIFAEILFVDRVDTGIDLDPVEVERARGTGAYDELIVCPGDRIPKPDASFATIFSNSVLEHIPVVEPVLKEVHRLLLPGGLFYITIPSDRLERATLPARVLSLGGLKALAARYGRFYNGFWRHYHAYDETRWRQLLEAAGFEVVEERAYVPRALSTVCDALTPIAFPSLIFRRALGRWTLWPPLRRVTAAVLHATLAPVLAALARGKGGCLIFYVLRRRT